jgi:hypothetical protein
VLLTQEETMTETEPTPDTWGAPAPERTEPRWSWKKTAAATAVALGVGGAGGFAVYAAGGAAADSAAAGGGGMMGGRGGMMGGPGAMMAPGGLMSALHGEYVVADGSGYATRVMQTGEVTEISDTAVTAKSTDGYTKTYTIDADTVRSAVKTGDTVMITATPSGDSATADSISAGIGEFRGGMPDGQGNQQPGVLPRRDGTSGSTQPTE